MTTDDLPQAAGSDVAPLLADEEDHPQDEVARHGDVRVIAIDSARYCDARNEGDVVIAASYCGVLPVRLMVPHRPRAIVGHDVNIAADGSGISGIFYAEALGIPAAAVAGSTAELGDGLDMYHSGRISRVNILAERCGVTPGMTTVEAARLLATNRPGSTEPGTKVRREVKVRDPDRDRSIVVTDSIVFALPDDSRNVLVTAGHTGKTGARFLEAVAPWGFICADGGGSKNGSGTAGLADLQDAGLAGACYDIMTAAMGDAFDAWERGRVSACNQLAQRRGVHVGQSVRDAANCLLGDDVDGETGPVPAVDHNVGKDVGSNVLRAGELAKVSPKFAEGLARVRDVTDRDGALPAGIKALFMAAAAAVKGHDPLARRELVRAVALGVTDTQLWGAAVSVLISRGEAVYERFVRSAREASPELAVPVGGPAGPFDATAAGACDYFVSYFGFVPDYVELMARAAPRALEGYFLMREWALAENHLEAKYVELLLCTVNAAEFSTRFVDIHAGGARRAGAGEDEIVEAVVCAIPVAGVASWLPGADGVAASAPTTAP